MDNEKINETKCPRANVYLDICKNEYNNEQARVYAIDTKSGILMATEVAYIGYLISNYISPNPNQVLSATFLTLSTLCLAYSFINLILILLVRKYCVFPVKKFGELKYLNCKEEHYAAMVAAKYDYAKELNKEKNDKKIQRFDYAIKSFILSLILCIIYYINN